ncbi:16324_t:CDS:2, partial [Dentiscutata heterogama]
GWFRAGSNPIYYLMGVDSAVFCDNAPGKSGFIKFDPLFEGKLTSGVFGTGDWKKCECVLDVDQDAVNLAFGVLVS